MSFNNTYVGDFVPSGLREDRASTKNYQTEVIIHVRGAK